jgi:hypothetical protein
MKTSAGALAAAAMIATLLAAPVRAGAQAPVTPRCAVLNIDDVMAQAQNQFAAGFSKAALELAVRALACSQDVRLYRMAAMFACGARDAVQAQLYFSKIPAHLQPAIAQRCLMESIVLAPAIPASAPSAATPSRAQPPASSPAPVASASARLRVATVSPAGVRCEMSHVDDLMYDAADLFIAGDAKGALSLASIALACKQDVRMLRMATIYACVARDDIAQRYYLDLPRSFRAAIQQRCRQEGIELLDEGARAAQPSAPAGPGAACAGVHADEIVDQAAEQFAAGFPRAALALMMKALNCQQNVRMFRTATTYACAVGDAVSAKRYFAQVPLTYQEPLVQRCRIQGLELVAP